MHDAGVWVALVSAVSALGAAGFAFTAQRGQTKVAKESGAVDGYDRLVADLQEDNAVLRAENRELRQKLAQRDNLG